MRLKCRRRRRRNRRWMPWRAWISTPSPSRSRGSGCCWPHCRPLANVGWRQRRISGCISLWATACLHGRHFGPQRDFAQELDEGFQRRLRHHYAREDTAAVDAILGRQYHAVVGNPPYITPKDPAMRDAYREIYASCHMKYGLGVPFIERFFDLASRHCKTQTAGFVGLIVANSFMKREFGSKLIEEVLPQLDLTHVVDCSGAYIPGHGTPTGQFFSVATEQPCSRWCERCEAFVASQRLRTIRRLAWCGPRSSRRRTIVNSTSSFISVEDTPRCGICEASMEHGRRRCGRYSGNY